MATSASVAKQRLEKSRKAGRKTQIDKSYPFVWSGANRKGDKVKGEILASNPAMAKAQLRKQGITPLKVRKKPKAITLGGGAKATSADIAVFVRQMATMMKSGVPLVQSFEIIGRGHENEAMQKLIMTVKADVESGTSFAQALRKHPKHFDDLFCDLVSAGEQSGSLEQMLERIATYKEKSEALKSKIKKAMYYPVAVFTVAMGVSAILLIWVVPMFEDLFQNAGGDLPAFTKAVVGLSEFMQSYWWAVILGIVAIVVAFSQANQRSAGFRVAKDRFLLKMPVFGQIIHKAAIARFARTLATTFAAGVPLVEALESAAGASGNTVHKSAILRIRDDVTTGMQMNLAMQGTGLFPNMVNQMVAIGEESGSVDSMLAKVADIYEAEVDDMVDGLSTLLEPIIIVILGTIIGSLIIAMYLPIFNMGSAF